MVEHFLGKEEVVSSILINGSIELIAVGDLDGDARPDAVTGGMHISRPYDRIGRITGWFTAR